MSLSASQAAMMTAGLLKRRAWLSESYSYPKTSHVHGGTWLYCNHPVPVLNKNGKRTGRYVPCGHRVRGFRQLFRHGGKKH